MQIFQVAPGASRSSMIDCVARWLSPPGPPLDVCSVPNTTEAIVSTSGTGDVEGRLARLEQRDERLTRALEQLAQREGGPVAKPGRDWDAYAAVIASFIGLLALAVSGYTAYVQRQQLRAQVWPHVVLWYSNVNLGLYVSNQGTGPARIAAVRVTVDGAPVKTWKDVQRVAGFTGDEGVILSTVHSLVLPADKDRPILQPRENEQSRVRFKDLLRNEAHPISITICYCSTLDDCWTAGFGNVSPEVIVDGRPQPPDACPIPAAEQFLD